VVSIMMPKHPGAARSSESSSDAEHNCRRKRYKWQKYGRPGHYGSHNTRHDGGHRGVDGVHKPESAEDEVAGEDEAKGASSQGDNDLQHIEFRI
jgi:hypothetical protein